VSNVLPFPEKVGQTTVSDGRGTSWDVSTIDLGDYLETIAFERGHGRRQVYVASFEGHERAVEAFTTAIRRDPYIEHFSTVDIGGNVVHY